MTDRVECAPAETPLSDANSFPRQIDVVQRARQRTTHEADTDD